ncbi:GTP-binding protein [Burkholderiaceae bacterium DAT-1]|nr:GTP-binding protein [Burkholderiaceae bacterium DAT-1]
MTAVNPTLIPVNIISGFLGVGKTTAIRHLLANKPEGEFWAVLVNEFGETGIDGAAISNEADPALKVVEVPGGCICCTTSPMLRASLVKLIQSRRPDRLLIEPSGLGHPSGIVDALRDKGLREALALAATVTLIDPRHLDDSRYTTHEIWRDQLQLADVLIANKTDRADAEHIDRFNAMAARMFPAKAAWATSINGAFDPALLDLPARPVSPYRQASNPHQADTSHSAGTTWNDTIRFDANRIAHIFSTLTDNVPNLLRAKGVFHTDHGWLLFNWVEGEISAGEIAWRRDSRFEMIVASSFSADATLSALEAARLPD